MKNNQKAIWYALLAVLLWSTVATAFKIALSYTNPYNLLLWSSSVSALIFLIYLIFTKKIKDLASYSLKDYTHSLLLGAINPFMYYVLLFNAYNELQAQEALILNYSWSAILVLLSALLLKQKISLKTLVAISLSFFGVIILATKGEILNMNFDNPLGVAIALLSAFFWAVYWLLSAKSSNRDEIISLFLNFTVGAILSGILAFSLSKFEWLRGEALLSVVYIGLFEMGITFFVWLKAMKNASHPANIANIIYLSPFISLALLSLILGERILISSLVAFALILAGIFLQILVSRK